MIGASGSASTRGSMIASRRKSPLILGARYPIGSLALQAHRAQGEASFDTPGEARRRARVAIAPGETMGPSDARISYSKEIRDISAVSLAPTLTGVETDLIDAAIALRARASGLAGMVGASVSALARPARSQQREAGREDPREEGAGDQHDQRPLERQQAAVVKEGNRDQ
jgi:hypothetical protein